MVPFHHEANALNNRFVGAFAAAISFWVIASGHLQFDTCESMKIPPELGHKQFIAVRNYVEGQTVFTVPLVEKNFCKLLNS